MYDVTICKQINYEGPELNHKGSPSQLFYNSYTSSIIVNNYRKYIVRFSHESIFLLNAMSHSFIFLLFPTNALFLTGLHFLRAVFRCIALRDAQHIPHQWDLATWQMQPLTIVGPMDRLMFRNATGPSRNIDGRMQKISFSDRLIVFYRLLFSIFTIVLYLCIVDLLRRDQESRT